MLLFSSIVSAAAILSMRRSDPLADFCGYKVIKLYIANQIIYYTLWIDD